MKKVFVSFLAATLFFAACNNAPKGDTAEVTEEETVSGATMEGTPYTVQPSSMVGFYGATPTHGQNGEFAISEGTLYVNEGNLSGGKVMADLNNMTVTTDGLEDEKKTKLKDHLLSEDFFNAAANPSVMFEITGATALEGDAENTHTISGNLTMNGKTNGISFPAKVTMGENDLNAKAKFVINRKDWGMAYKNDKSLGDEWIYDDVEMTLDVTAMK